MENIFQQLTIKELINLALNTRESGTVRFSILQRALICILKELNIEDCKTNYYKFNNDYYLLSDKLDIENQLDTGEPILKVVKSSPPLFQKPLLEDTIIKEESKNINLNAEEEIDASDDNKEDKDNFGTTYENGEKIEDPDISDNNKISDISDNNKGDRDNFGTRDGKDEKREDSDISHSNKEEIKASEAVDGTKKENMDFDSGKENESKQFSKSQDDSSNSKKSSESEEENALDSEFDDRVDDYENKSYLREDKSLPSEKLAASDDEDIHKASHYFENLEDLQDNLNKNAAEIQNNFKELDSKMEAIASDIIQKLNNKLHEVNDKIQKINEESEKLKKYTNDLSISVSKLEKDKTLHDALEQVNEKIGSFSSDMIDMRTDLTNLTEEIKHLDLEKVNIKDLDEVKNKQENYLALMTEKVNLIDFDSIVKEIRHDVEQLFEELTNFNNELTTSITENKDFVETEIRKLEHHLSKQDKESEYLKSSTASLRENVENLKTSLQTLKKTIPTNLMQPKTAVSAGTKTCICCGRSAVLSGGDYMNQEGRLIHDDRQWPFERFKEKTCEDNNTSSNTQTIENMFKEKRKCVYVPAGYDILGLDGTLYKNCRLEKKTDKEQTFSLYTNE